LAHGAQLGGRRGPRLRRATAAAGAARLTLCLVGQFDVADVAVDVAPAPAAEANVELLLAVLARGGVPALAEVCAATRTSRQR
jgi:hypothetical protein